MSSRIRYNYLAVLEIVPCLIIVFRIKRHHEFSLYPVAMIFSLDLEIYENSVGHHERLPCII